MTLEDAHGNLLPLPIELVVSWEVRRIPQSLIWGTNMSQMLDSILVSHFQALPGEKKVQNREFAIEDSETRGLLTRKDPWIAFSKPGRKIDMSMIFKDTGKTSVVCPKCDTISKENKGVQVEW